MEIRLTNEKLDARKIKDIGLPSDATIGLISRGGDVIIASPETILRKGDLLTIISKTEASKDVITLLKG